MPISSDDMEAATKAVLDLIFNDIKVEMLKRCRIGKITDIANLCTSLDALIGLTILPVMTAAPDTKDAMHILDVYCKSLHRSLTKQYHAHQINLSKLEAAFGPKIETPTEPSMN